MHSVHFRHSPCATIASPPGHGLHVVVWNAGSCIWSSKVINLACDIFTPVTRDNHVISYDIGLTHAVSGIWA